MKRSTKKWMAMVLSAQTLAAGGAAGAPADRASGDPIKVVENSPNQPVGVKPGALKGRVINPADKKPWAKTSVELIDAKTGKVLKKTRTGKDGAYDLGEVKEGTYTLRINGKIEMPLRVSSAASASTLNIAVPKAVMGKIVGSAVSWTTVGLVGAGIATAVAVPVAVSGGDGGSDDASSASGS
jgi:hypothetical protein